jgi:hypothetical protein
VRREEERGNGSERSETESQRIECEWRGASRKSRKGSWIGLAVRSEWDGTSTCEKEGEGEWSDRVRPGERREGGELDLEAMLWVKLIIDCTVP